MFRPLLRCSDFGPRQKPEKVRFELTGSLRAHRFSRTRITVFGTRSRAVSFFNNATFGVVRAVSPPLRQSPEWRRAQGSELTQTRLPGNGLMVPRSGGSLYSITVTVGCRRRNASKAGAVIRVPTTISFSSAFSPSK